MEEKEKSKVVIGTASEISEEENDKISEVLISAKAQGQMMDQLIKNQIQVKDEMIDKLHKELENYKQDSVGRFIDQLMKSVIKVRKDMLKQINSENWSQMTGDELRREYTYSFEDITDLLEQQNIDPYKSEEGERFDPSRHQAYKIEETDNRELDKTIKESISEGFIKDNRAFIVERVNVYKYIEEK